MDQARERHWQESWAGRSLGTARWLPGQEKFFALVAYPGSSGFLHLGHLRGLMYADAAHRYHRAMGHATFFPTGTHASGLPSVTFAQKVARRDPADRRPARAKRRAPERMASPIRSRRGGPLPGPILRRGRPTAGIASGRARLRYHDRRRLPAVHRLAVPPAQGAGSARAGPALRLRLPDLRPGIRRPFGDGPVERRRRGVGGFQDGAVPPGRRPRPARGDPPARDDLRSDEPLGPSLGDARGLAPRRGALPRAPQRRRAARRAARGSNRPRDPGVRGLGPSRDRRPHGRDGPGTRELARGSEDRIGHRDERPGARPGRLAWDRRAAPWGAKPARRPARDHRIPRDVGALAVRAPPPRR